jgi:soluble lytic murein transglycosylase-like protein
MGLDEAGKVARIVEREAGKYDDVDPFRVLAFIVAESQGNPGAVSQAGARGLMQIMPGTGQYIASAREEKWRGSKSLHETETNISYGVWYYQHLLKVFDGDEQAAIAAYNWGPEHITWRLKEGRRLPTVYPGKVIEAQRELEREFSHESTYLFWQRLGRDKRGESPEPR